VPHEAADHDFLGRLVEDAVERLRELGGGDHHVSRGLLTGQGGEPAGVELDDAAVVEFRVRQELEVEGLRRPG
jgi:hypothetical protein